MQYDVIVIGGSYAGMAAALQLVRARRSVLVVDAGHRRNRFVSRSHGFLGHDGDDPALLAATARQQLEKYSTYAGVSGEAVEARGSRDGFTVALSGGASFEARRLLFATGVSDELPAIEGLGERWGRSVFHCPYCHGYELDEGAIGVIATGPNSVHQAQFVAEWGQVTFLTNGTVTLAPEMRRDLAARGVTIEETRVARLTGSADVQLSDGRMLAFAGVFTAPRCAPATPIAQRLGCRLEETPFGTQTFTTETKETSVPGAFACGDAARVPHSVSLAVADGAWAGMHLHRSLVFDQA